jgi:hypothetical protein
VLADLAEQGVDLSLERLPLDRQLDRGRRALQAVQVLAQRERAAVVKADHLEDAVPAQQAVVVGRDARVRGG